MSGASSTAGGWEDLCDEKPEEKVKKDVVHLWGKFLTKYLKIRKLQRIFRGTGNYLSELVSKECRERLSRTYSLKK